MMKIKLCSVATCLSLLFLQVLSLLVDRAVGRVAADGFYVIMADYEEVMSTKMHVNYRVSFNLELL